MTNQQIALNKSAIGDPIKTAHIDEIKNNIKIAFVLIGLRNLPSPEETAVLVDFLRFSYPNFATGEIRLAFQLAVAGKLDVDPSHYESFSSMYVSKILNSYRRYQTEQPAPKMEPPKQLAPSDGYMAEWIDELKLMKKSGKLRIDLVPVTVYDHLKAAGKINGSNQHLERAGKLHHDKLVANGETKLAKNLRDEMANGFIGPDFKIHVLMIAKQIALWEYL